MSDRCYLAYLLRMWRDAGGREGAWRASLEDPRSGERLGFGSLEDLYAYLQARAAGWNGTGEGGR